jgi:rubrerythrin
MILNHPKLIKLLQKAYSAEKAASLAYIGHASSLKDPEQIAAIKQIEDDEWEHRAEVLKIMQQYDIPISQWHEFQFHVIGKVIGFSCHIIGRFMPYYFA